MTISPRFTARSNVGLARQSNQDSGYAGSHLCFLCDGMGGPADGDIASAVAAKHLMPLDTDSHQADGPLGFMCDVVQAAHTELVTLSSQNPDLTDLGATCIGVMRNGNKLVMIHVDDSCVRMLRNGTLTQVTAGHTFVEYFVKTRRLIQDQARQYPQRSVPLYVLGGTEGEVQLGESIRETVPGDRWLLCFSGLGGPVTAETIGEALVGVADPGQAVDQLIDLALRVDGLNSTTTVIFDATEDDPEPRTVPQVVGNATTEHLAQGRIVTAHRADDEQAETEGAEVASPAARAAALMAVLEDKPEAASARESPEVDGATAAETVTQGRARRCHCRRVLVGNLVLLVTLVGTSTLFYRWTRTRYYVSTYKGEVAIYQGIPQFVNPLKLSRLVKTYADLPMESLNYNTREHLETAITQSSMSAAETYVDKTVRSYRRQALAPQGIVNPTAKPSSSSSSTPSPVSTTSAQLIKPGQEG